MPTCRSLTACLRSTLVTREGVPSVRVSATRVTSEVNGSGVSVVRFFKFVWYYRKIGKPSFARETAEKRLDLKSLKGRKKGEELRRRNSGTEGPPEVGGPSLKIPVLVVNNKRAYF